MKKITVIIILSVLVGCASSPVNNYYVLTTNSAEKSASIRKSVIGLFPVELPEYLLRTQIVYTDSGNALVLSKTERWSEPLDKAIQRVLTINLAKLDDNRSIIDFPWRNVKSPAYTLRVQIRELDRAAPGKAVLVADWYLLETDTRAVVYHGKFSQASELKPFSYTSLVKSYSDLLAYLSDDIHQQLSGILENE